MVVHVDSYTKEDGTKVKAHTRSEPDVESIKFSKEDLDEKNFKKTLDKKKENSKKIKKLAEKAENINQNRSKQARKQDNNELNHDTYKFTPETVKRWKENPGRHDLEGIDTPKKQKENNKKENNKTKKEDNVIHSDRHYNNKSYGLGGYKAFLVTKEGEVKKARTDYDEKRTSSTYWRTYKTIATEPGIYVAKGKKRTKIIGVKPDMSTEQLKSTKSKIRVSDLPSIVKKKTDDKFFLKIIDNLEERRENKRENEKEEQFYYFEYTDYLDEINRKSGNSDYIISEEGSTYKVYSYNDGKSIFIEDEKTKIENLNYEKIGLDKLLELSYSSNVDKTNFDFENGKKLTLKDYELTLKNNSGRNFNIYLTKLKYDGETEIGGAEIERKARKIARKNNY